MAGSISGGKKAAQTNKAKYGEDFYVRTGRLGGQKGRTGGFFANRELAREAGRRGGMKSKVGPRWPPRLCTKPDCFLKHRARGLCDKHYSAYKYQVRRERLQASVDATDEK